MRFLSALLITSMLFLSFSGMVKPSVAPGDVKNCCPMMTSMKHGAACHNNNLPHQNKGCDKQGCQMMMICRICGFLNTEPLIFQPAPAKYIAKPVPYYIIGNLSTYHSSDWKPPEIS